MNDTYASLLVVDNVRHVDNHPSQLQVDLRIGGHPINAIFDFARRDIFIEYIVVPWLLGIHPPSVKAVAEVAARVDAGDNLTFPIDLSNLIINAEEPSPFLPLPPEDEARLCEEAERVTLVVEELLCRGSSPALFTGYLKVDSLPVTLRAELYYGEHRIPAIRWLKGSNPQELSQAQHVAIQRLLLSQVQAI